MKLEEVLALEGIKLIDTSVLRPPGSPFSSLKEGGREFLESFLKKLKNLQILLNKNRTAFFVNGVIREYREFYSLLKGYYSSEKEEARDEGTTISLRDIIKQLQGILTIIKGRDITGNEQKKPELKYFSDSERNEYFNLFKRLKDLTTRHPELKTGHETKPHELYTDESLVAAAMVISRREPATIITKDRDISSILSGLGKVSLEHKISVYRKEPDEYTYNLVYNSGVC